jgi:membrane protein implicated in regulation of membrane protease activity
MAGPREGDMSATKIFLACIWGAAAFYLLCYGITYRSVDSLLLFAALAPALVILVWWMSDRASLERRIKRLEARSEIAAENRVVMQTDISEVEHKLEQVKTRVAYSEKINAPV